MEQKRLIGEYPVKNRIDAATNFILDNVLAMIKTSNDENMKKMISDDYDSCFAAVSNAVTRYYNSISDYEIVSFCNDRCKVVITHSKLITRAYTTLVVSVRLYNNGIISIPSRSFECDDVYDEE